MSEAVYIPVASEALEVKVRDVVTERIRVATTTETIDETIQAELVSDEVEVSRVPIDRVVDRMPDIRVEGDVTIVPVVEEVLFIEKRLVLTEEIHIKRHQSTEDVEMTVPVKKQHLTIERTPVETIQAGDDNE